MNSRVAFNQIKQNCGCNGVVMIRCSSCTAKECKMFEAMKTIQELVDRNTPKHPISEPIGIGGEGHLAGYAGVEHYCPHCDNIIDTQFDDEPSYCVCCGQALDWNDIDDFYDEDEGDYD